MVEERQWWSSCLGAGRDPDGWWQRGSVVPVPVLPGWRSDEVSLHSYGSRLTARVVRPDRSGVSEPVVVVPFYEVATLFGETCERTAGRPRWEDQAFALHLAAHGLSVLAVPWWGEQEASAHQVTRTRSSLAERYGPAARCHQQQWAMTGLGRSIGDLMLAIDFLADQPWVDNGRIGAFGHSLGAKLALHLAALDTRVAVGAAHEAGLGFDHSNWRDPWYVGDRIPTGRDQDELLGLVAPRPFLLAGGGDSDGPDNRDLVERARRHWPEPDVLQLLHHDGGHAFPQHVRLACMAWLADWLAAVR